MTELVKRAKEEKKARRSFSSMSFPTLLIKEVEGIVEELGYWPTKTAFIREAVMEKMERHKKELEVRRAHSDNKKES